MTDLVFGQWLPDQADLENAGLTECKNCIPDIGFYRSFPSATVFSSAMTDAPKGMWSGVNEELFGRTYVGTSTKLYEVTSATPIDLSGSGYNVPYDGWWEFVRYNSELYATNGSDPIQKTTLNASQTFTALGDLTNPLARHMCIAKDFLVLGNTYDSTDGTKTQRVWWSSIGDPSQFPTPGSVLANQTQSDWQNLNDVDGGPINAIFGGDDLTIFMQQSIWRGQYIGGNFVWQFGQVAERRGLALARCAIRVSETIFFLDKTGFFKLIGTQVTPIGYGKVDRYFWGNVNSNYKDLTHCAADFDNKTVFWAYVDANSGSTIPDRALCYNLETGFWSRIHITANMLFYSVTGGISLDDMDPFGTMDALTIPLDSSYWGGGIGRLSGIDSSFRLVYYTGTALDALIETQEQEIEGYRRSIISGVRPVVNGGPTITIQIGTRDLQSGMVSYGASALVNTVNGWHDLRAEGRYHRIRVSTTGAFTKLIGLDFLAQNGGLR